MFAQDGLQVLLSVLMGGVPIIELPEESGRRSIARDDSGRQESGGMPVPPPIRGAREPTFNFQSSVPRPFGPLGSDEAINRTTDSSNMEREQAREWGITRDVLDSGPPMGPRIAGLTDNLFGRPPDLVSDMFGPSLFGVRVQNAFGSGRDFQYQLENIIMRSLIMDVLQQAQQSHPAFPPLTNEEKKFLEYQSLSPELVHHLKCEGCEECTVCQETFQDILKECEDYAACPSVTSHNEEEPIQPSPRINASGQGADQQEATLETSGKYHRRHDVSVCRLPCNHFFCKECLLKWMAYTSTCPNCRMRLENLGEKYNGKDGNLRLPAWWSGVKDPESVEVEEKTPEPSILVSSSPVPVPLMVPRPPSRQDSTSQNPRNNRIHRGPHPEVSFTPASTPPSTARSMASEPSSPAVLRVSTNSLEDSSRLMEMVSEPEEFAPPPSTNFSFPPAPASPASALTPSNFPDRFSAPSVRSPHRVPPAEPEEEVTFDSLPQGGGARVVRRLRHSRRTPTQDRLSNVRRPVNRTSTNGTSNNSRTQTEAALFPRIQLSRASSGPNQMRVVPVRPTPPPQRPPQRDSSSGKNK